MIFFMFFWFVLFSGIFGVYENLFKFMVVFFDFKIFVRCFGDCGGCVIYIVVKLKIENSGEENESN